MQALFFEVHPRPGHEDHYFERAAALRPELDKQPGLITIDRYKSLTRPDVILSHSLWQDEASLARWRSEPNHHAAQIAGRHKHFADYRLRIAQIIYRWAGGLFAEGAMDGLYNDPTLTDPRFLVIVISKDQPAFGDGESYLSVNNPGSYATIVDAASEKAGRVLISSVPQLPHIETAALGLVSRDYGMFNRAEAPQYFPDLGT